MTVAEAIKVQGDYDLRGPDFETLLVGPISATIVDADREVRSEWRNGFPNWALYRCVLAGDTHLRPVVRMWCVAFAAAYCEAGGIRKGAGSDELAALAGWDAYSKVMTGKWVASGADVAEVAEVDPKTYRRIRGYVAARIEASLGEYWIRMQVAFRQVVLAERWADHTPSADRFSSGRGFNQAEDMSGTGNYRAVPRGSGC